MHLILEIVGHRENEDHILIYEIAELVAASIKGGSLKVTNSTGQCNRPFVCLKKFVSKGQGDGMINYSMNRLPKRNNEETTIAADTRKIFARGRGVKELLGKEVRVMLHQGGAWKEGTIVAANLYDDSKPFSCPIK